MTSSTTSKPARVGLGRTQPGMGHLHVQDLEYRAARNAGQLDVPACDIVRHSPAASVGPQGERYPDPLPRYYVESVGAVSRGEDIRVRGAQGFVHRDGILRTQVEPGLGGNFRIGHDTHAHEHQVNIQRASPKTHS